MSHHQHRGHCEPSWPRAAVSQAAGCEGVPSFSDRPLSPPLSPAHLDDAVLGCQPCCLSWRAGVDSAHVLPWAALVTVQVEAIAIRALLHVAQPRSQLLLQWEQSVGELLLDPQHPRTAPGTPDSCWSGRDTILSWPPVGTDTSRCQTPYDPGL